TILDRETPPIIIPMQESMPDNTAVDTKAPGEPVGNTDQPPSVTEQPQTPAQEQDSDAETDAEETLYVTPPASRPTSKTPPSPVNTGDINSVSESIEGAQSIAR